MQAHARRRPESRRHDRPLERRRRTPARERPTWIYRGQHRRHVHRRRRDKSTGGELNAAIARAVVRIHRNCVGRGPTKAHAFFHGSIVVVVLEDALLRVERTLVAGGYDDSVIRLRQDVLAALRPGLIAAVERLTDRQVMALIGDTNPKAGVVSQIFVVDRPIQTRPTGATGDTGFRHRAPQTT